MSNDAIKSKAFQLAALKSESYRIAGILCLLGSLVLFVIARGVVTGRYGLLVAQSILLAIVITHESLMLRAVRRALRSEGEVSRERWVLNVFIESQIPTLGLFLLLANPWLTPYQVLVGPIICVYFLLISLSTLRLSPVLTIMTGVLSSFGYLFVTFYVQLRYEDLPEISSALPQAAYFVYAGAIFMAGLIAAFVAAQIRDHVSAALREAELQKELEQVNHDLDVARSIQQGLLPSEPPGLDQFDVAGWNQPADQTGGDYFDWQTLPDGRLAISLGDATGHGIGPALVSASCRAYARASFLANGGQDGLLDRLNRLLVDDLSSNRFITFAVALLDPSSTHVKILSAGHGPIMWSRYITNDIENLEAQGIPLGMIAGVKYGTGTEVRLASGDMLVMVTDGFYEWENPEGEQFGLNRLETVLRESRDYSAAEVISRLRSAVATFCRGTEQMDDLTAVVLKRKKELSSTLKEVHT